MVYCPKCGKSMATYVEHNCARSEIQIQKICEIANSRFCYFLRVDGQSISFQGNHNADYFENHYANLGYEVERIDQHND